MSDEEPRKCDILFGKGSDCWNHAGNKKFRFVVDNYQAEYHSINCRSEKVKLVARIVQEIRSSGVRFLRRNVESKAWEEVDRKAIIEKVGHAIRDKQQAKHRNRGSTENFLMPNLTDVRDINKVNQSRETRMVNNGYLRPILSQELSHMMNFQIEDYITSNPVFLNRYEHHLRTGHATYDRNLISGFSVDRNKIPYQPYSQQNGTHTLGELPLSILSLWYHQYDFLRDSVLNRRRIERMTNTVQRLSRLESQVLTNLRQQANVDALHLSTFGLNQENICSNLRFFHRRLDGSNGKIHPFASLRL